MLEEIRYVDVACDDEDELDEGKRQAVKRASTSRAWYSPMVVWRNTVFIETANITVSRILGNKKKWSNAVMDTDNLQITFLSYISYSCLQRRATEQERRQASRYGPVSVN